MADNLYQISDAGCYVDGARGIYANDAVIKFATSHGFAEPECDCRFECDCDASQIADEATDFMNENFPVEGATWGWNDGDWGLYVDVDEDTVWELDEVDPATKITGLE